MTAPINDRIDAALQRAAELAEAVDVQLVGPGPFLLPLVGGELSFGMGDAIAVMQMRTTAGQEILVPLQKETLRSFGVALASALQEAFPQPTIVSNDLSFERREEA